MNERVGLLSRDCSYMESRHLSQCSTSNVEPVIGVCINFNEKNVPVSSDNQTEMVPDVEE